MVTISVEALQELRTLEPDIYIVDVREPEEIAIVSLEGAHPIPLSDLSAAVDRLPHDQKIFTLCHHGVRSLKAAQWLISQGFDACSIQGGIHAWAIKIDPGMATY